MIVSFLFLFMAAEPEWKKRKEKSGIEVFTRTVEGAPMDEFKGTITISNAELTDILNVIMDIDKYPKWIPDCMEAKILAKDEKYHSIHYVAIKAPWPVKNRDAIYEMNAIFSENDKKIRINFKPRGDYVQSNKQFIRLYKGSGFWELEELEENEVKITYQFLGEPGGKIPIWLANSFVVNNPYLTLRNLKNVVKK